MSKEVIEKRIIEITKAIEETSARHSMLLGHLNEAKFIVESIFKAECEAKAEKEGEPKEEQNAS